MNLAHLKLSDKEVYQVEIYGRCIHIFLMLKVKNVLERGEKKLSVLSL